MSIPPPRPFSPSVPFNTPSNLYGRIEDITVYDEAEEVDADTWYTLGRSIGCIAPGTAVKLSEPGLIVPVSSMDDVDLVAPRETATSIRAAHVEALRSAQQGIEQDVVGEIGHPRRHGLSTSYAQQQQAVLTQRELERAVEQLSGMRGKEVRACPQQLQEFGSRACP